MYVAVKGGETAIANSLDLLADVHFAYAGRSTNQVVHEVYDLLGIDVMGGNHG